MMKNLLPLWLLIALVGFPQISETIYTPSLPMVALGLKAQASMVEWTLAIYFVGFALGVLTWGAVSDVWGRRKTMLMGLVLYTAASIVCAMAPDVLTLLFWRFVQAFGASVGSVVTQTMLRDLYDGHKRRELFSFVGGCLAFSPAVGPLLGGYVSEFLGWRANFWTLVGMGVWLLIWTYSSLGETKPKNAPARPSFVQLAYSMVGSLKIWGHVLLIGAANGIIFSFYEEAPFVFIEQLGILPSQYGLLGILIASATLVAARISFLLTKRFSAERIVAQGAWMSVGGGGLFFLLIAWGQLRPEVWSLALALGALFVLFTGIGLIIPNSLSIALRPYKEAVGSAGSLFGGAYYLVIAFCTWMMSVLHTGTAMPLALFLLTLTLFLVMGAWLIQERSLKSIAE